MSNTEPEHDDSVTRLFGSAVLFERAAEYDEFLSWLRRSHEIQDLDEILAGFRLYSRSALHVLGYSYLMHSNTIGIDRDFLFVKSIRELGDINKVQSNCEAAALSRHISKHNRQIALANSFEELKSRLDEATEEIAQPLTSKVPDLVRSSSDSFSPHEAALWAAAEQCFTFLVDQREDMPWALYVSDFDIHLSNKSELDAGIRGYALALEFVWRNLAQELGMDDSLFDGMHRIGDWRQLDEEYYGELQNQFFRPIEEEFSVGLGESALTLDSDLPQDTFAHLLADDRVPVIGKEEQLKQLLLWEHAERFDQHSLDKGALFISVVEGIARVRQGLDVDEPVFVRRFVHPDPEVDGNNYSYAVRVDQPHILGSGGMRGWATFVRAGTDYSGYGGAQYERVEERLDALSSEGLVDIQEMQLGEQQFKKFLDKNHGSISTTFDEEPDISREPRYAGMTVEEILEGESEKVEFKRQFPGADKLAKEIGALANTAGGVVVIGIEDDESIFGVEDTESLQLRVANMATSDKFRPPIYPNFEPITLSGKEILIIEIEELDRPCAVNYRYYARVGTSVEAQLFEELKQRFD